MMPPKPSPSPDAGRQRVAKAYQFLKKQRYQLNHSHVGWWVDGGAGFLVGDGLSGYFNRRMDAVLNAARLVRKAIRNKEWPTWRIQ